MPGHFCGQVFCISYVVSRFVLVIVVWKTTTFEMTASPFWDFMSLLSLDVTVEMSKYKKKIITFRHCTRPVWALARCHNFSLSLYYSFLWEWMANMKSFGVRVHASTTFCSVGRFLFLHFHYDRAQPNTFMDCIWWTDSQSIWLTRLSDFHFGILAWCTQYDTSHNFSSKQLTIFDAFNLILMGVFSLALWRVPCNFVSCNFSRFHFYWDECLVYFPI